MKQKKQTEELQARIAELESCIQRLDTQAEELDERASVKCRAGWCYVISNPSMPNYVKIGVTRRIDPNVRIQELSTASVPFKMNTHATIFAQDAFELESLLHSHFNDKRVNKVNFHKEWFEVSIDEPLNVDWDGNELLLSDILGTDEDIIYRDLEDEVDKKLLKRAISTLNDREKLIISLRFGINTKDGEERTQKEVADILGISQSYISRLEKKIIKRLRKEMIKLS